MKNIQLIERALNAVYDIYAAPDELFDLVFPPGTDVAFTEEIKERPNASKVFEALQTIYRNRVPKANAIGVHGILFHGLRHKRQYYPTLRDEEATNPDGSPLR